MCSRIYPEMKIELRKMNKNINTSVKNRFSVFLKITGAGTVAMPIYETTVLAKLANSLVVMHRTFNT